MSINNKTRPLTIFLLFVVFSIISTINIFVFKGSQKYFPFLNHTAAVDLAFPDFSYDLINGNTEAEISGYTGAGGNVTIPGTLDGYPVTSIATTTFGANTSITAVIFPDSLVNIGVQAFASTTGLTSITFGANSQLASIADGAFYGIPNWQMLTIPSTVTNIGNEAFANNNALAEVYFLGNAPTVGSGIFASSSDPFIIRYYASTTGWSNPLWNGYTTASYTNPAISITDFINSITIRNGETVTGSGFNVAVTIPYINDVTNLIPTYTTETPGVVVMVGNTSQTSGVTENDFTNPVIYTIIVPDTPTQNFIVTVTVGPQPRRRTPIVVEELVITPTEILLPQATNTEEIIATTTVATTTEIVIPEFCFGKNLQPYKFDKDVKQLQRFLNSHGFDVTKTGAEYNFYDTKTVSAVSLFQEYYADDILTPVNLKKGTGNFGNSTRKKVNDLLGCKTIFEEASTTPEHIIAVNNDLIIRPEQSGMYTKDTDVGKVIIDVPVSAILSKTTFTTKNPPLTISNKNLVMNNTWLVNKSFYDVTAKDENQNLIHTFNVPITLTLPLPSNISNTNDLGVYWLDETTNEWVLIPDAVFVNGEAIFQVDHLTRFAIFSTGNEPIVPEVLVVVPEEDIPPEQIPQKQPETQQTATQNDGKVDISQPTPRTITDSIKETYEQAAVAIQETYKETVVIAKATAKATKEIVNSPTGSVVTKTVSTVGVVAGASVSVSTVAFATPVSFTEIWLIPTRLFGLLLGALGVRRKSRQWGTVYDSVTKRPIDPAYVSLINMKTHKEVMNAITDLDGRYGFLVLPGKYKIVAEKTNYKSPSKQMMGRAFDEVYNDLYFGEEIVVKQEGEIITKNIPMDPQAFDWNEFNKKKTNLNTFIKAKDILWARISKVLFFVGALISLIALIFAPAPYNFVIAGFYVVTYILNYVVFKTKKSGILKEKETKLPLSFAIVNIYREGENTPLTKKIADKLGAYYALVPKGNYYIKIDKKEADGTYKEVLKTKVMEINTGIINNDFEV